MKRSGQLPYRWRPLGTRDVKVPSVGQIIAWDHQAWRVVAVNLLPEIDWTDRQRREAETWADNPAALDQHLPRAVIVRPVHITADDPRSRDHDVHLVRHGWSGFDVYPDEHYPVCAQCAEPLPCRDEMARRTAEQESAQADRYMMPGVCPACNEPITSRQKALISFEENLEIPGGPPLTFHRRRACLGAAISYEKRWAAADHGNRRTTLSCPGSACRHTDGIECTEDPRCPGHELPHARATACHPAYGDSCQRCSDGIKARNAAGDWTVWA